MSFTLLQIYPDEGHFMEKASVKQHLHKSIVRFFEKCFSAPDKAPLKTEVEEEEDD